MPEPITAPMPSAMRLHTPSVLRRHLSGSSEAAISASMLLVRNSGEATVRVRDYRLRWPLVIFWTFFLFEPRDTPAARLAFGAAFLRDVRFSFLRSVRSLTCLVFILPGFLRIFESTSSSRNLETQLSVERHRRPLRGAAPAPGHTWDA